MKKLFIFGSLLGLVSLTGCMDEPGGVAEESTDGQSVAGTTLELSASALLAGETVHVTPATSLAGVRNPGADNKQLAGGGIRVGASSTNTLDKSTSATLALASTTVAKRAPRICESAERDPNTDWTVYRDACRSAIASSEVGATTGVVNFALGRSATYCASHPLEVDCNDIPATSVTSANFANVPVWSDADIWAQFRSTRDKRFIPDSSGFVRRPSWLYPNDGCWIRAELAATVAAEAGKPKPYKLFSFGNLVVSTPNAKPPATTVSWGWHVVPIVKSASSGQVYVLDAAIDASQPLTWQAWLLRQVPTLNDVRVTIADSAAYGPWSSVQGGTATPKATAMSDLQTYLNLEWNRQQVDLGRDAVSLLGFFPPWGNVGKDFDSNRKSDIVWRHPVNGTTQYWYMDNLTRTGYANIPYTVAESTGWKYAGQGDFNRDGKADIIWYHPGAGTVQIWYMDGLNRTSWGNLSNTVPASSGWTFAGVDDFNLDGMSDIVWHNGSTGYTQIWYLNDSLGLVSWPNLDPRYLVADSSGWTFAGTGDFNRDGRVDVIWRHGQSGTMQFWYLNEVTMNTFANLPYTVADSSGWHFFAARDVNYDGKLDITWHHGAQGTIQHWYMDGLTRTSWSNLPYTVAESTGWFEGGY
ncbi:MAG: protein-glutamine glutaminase family protein [Polyangiaceae bacterium]